MYRANNFFLYISESIWLKSDPRCSRLYDMLTRGSPRSDMSSMICMILIRLIDGGVEKNENRGLCLYIQLKTEIQSKPVSPCIPRARYSHHQQYKRVSIYSTLKKILGFKKIINT